VPVALGRTRSLQDQSIDAVTILIHGDAAFSGQGVVFESLQLSQLPGYQVGGSLHIILNNQIGFTATPKEGRSTRYCSDIAKAMGCPILHVNADDVEMVVWAFELAVQYRYQFHKDIVIDLVGYRRHGHNEGDEPSYTHPLMYKAIAQKPTVASLYGQSLKEQGVLTPSDGFKKTFTKILQEGLDANSPAPLIASPTAPRDDKNSIDLATLKKLGLETLNVPNGFHIHPKLERILAKRREQIEKEDTIRPGEKVAATEGEPGEHGAQKRSVPNVHEHSSTGMTTLSPAAVEFHGGYVDWATAESLAFASLLNEGHPVRLAGQDSKRGTFSQRHAEWVDTETNASYCPFKNLDIVNSPLSEAAALGFEYGYSLALKGLTMWEAQFGDFVNGAQVIIDQYISAGYSKWLQPSNLVLLLPHGYEGQGPEHSSARLERFLQLSAEENWLVVVCSTPANYFHLLRQQATGDRPLIVLTPKSLLRHPKAVSPWQNLGHDFKPVIGDYLIPPTQAEKIILCTGKVYYDLLAYRQQHQHAKTAIVRIEQLYPFPEQELAAVLKGCTAQPWVWCQEEPQNMGAWSFVAPFLKFMNADVVYAGRTASASPATGFAGRHAVEQNHFIEQAFAV